MGSSSSDYVYSLLHVKDQWNQQIVSFVQMQSYGNLRHLLFHFREENRSKMYENEAKLISTE